MTSGGLSKKASLSHFFILFGQTMIGATFILIVYRTTNPERILGFVVLIALVAFLAAACVFNQIYLGDAARRAARIALFSGPAARASTRRLFLAGLFILLTFLAWFVLLRFPNSADEFAYLFQAATLQELRFWNATHPVQEFFTFSHIAEQEGRWVGRFPPGWPLVLAVFNTALIPYWLVNPILGSLTLVVLWRFSREFYGRRVATLTLLGFAFSGFFLFNAASFFSHTLSGLLLVTLTYYGCRYLEVPRWGYAAAIGALAAGLAITRYYTAALCILPFAVALLRTWSIRHWIGGGIMIAAGLPILGLLFFYNYKITGDPFLLVTRWHDPDETLGFIRGYDIWDVPQRIWRWTTDYGYYTSPLMLLLWIWSILRQPLNNLRFFDFYFPLLLIGYVYFYSDGANRYGPRYLYAAYPFMTLRIAIGIDAAMRRYPATGAARLLPLLFLLHIGMTAVNLPINAVRNHQIIYERRDLLRTVEQAELSDALVVVRSGTGVVSPLRPADLLFNDVDLAGEVIYAHDRPREMQSLRRHFPDRTFWLYERPDGRVRGRLIRLPEETAEETEAP